MLHFCLSANFSLNCKVWNGCYVCRIFSVHTEIWCKRSLDIAVSHIWWSLMSWVPSVQINMYALSSFACSRTENMVTCSFLWSWNKASHFTRVFLYPSVGPYPDAASKNPFLNFFSFSPLWQWLSFSPGGINKSVLSFDLGREAELPLMAQWAQSL